MTAAAPTADPSTGPQSSTVTSIDDFGPGKRAYVAMYKAEIAAAEKENEDWKKQAHRVIRRYRDERKEAGFLQNTKRYNMLWSIINTTMPAVYGRPPEPVVMRRYTDPDQVARVASLILERTLTYQIECQPDFYPSVRNSLQDRLLPGMGCAWVRYQKDQTSPTGTIDNDYYARLAGQLAALDFVYWEDFGYVTARTWEEVPVVWRVAYMTKDQLKTRFGAKLAETIPLDYLPARHGSSQATTQETDEPTNKVFKQARIYEIWDKRTSKVCWLHLSMPDYLDEKDDPIRFPGFFPCPKPLFATNTTGNLTPVPDYVMYQDQANEIDTITQRLYMLTQALKVVGVYDQSQAAIQRMLTEGVDNQMIPVDTWAAFAEKGGIKGVIDFLPLEQVIMVVDKLYTIRGQLIEDIYQITGLSDIIRGASNPNETLGAQRIKAQFASVRLEALKMELARFVTDILRLMGHIIVNFFDDATIIAQSSIQQSPDGQKAIKDAQKAQQARMAAMQPPPMPQSGAPSGGAPPPGGLPPPPVAPGAGLLPGPPQLGPPPGPGGNVVPLPLPPPSPPSIVEQALRLLRQGRQLDYRIEIVSDSMVAPDLQEEQQQRTEFLTATTQFLQEAIPAAEANPQLLPLMQALLMFGVRGFRSGTEIEGVIDATFEDLKSNPPPPKPDAKAEALKAKTAADTQATQQKAAADAQAAQADLQATQAEHAMKLQGMQQEFALEVQRMRNEFEAMNKETQAKIEAILIKANVEAKIAQDKAVQDAEAAAAKQEQDVIARAQDMALDQAEREMEPEASPGKSDA